MNIKTLPANTSGRDFVVGDLHGCFDQLQRFMDFISFDPSKDRMFSVGDLVDRGPKNVECLELLRKPWFHAVRGNHEDLMIDWFTDGPTRQWWFPNGGDWFMKIQGTDTGDVVRQDLLPLVQKLPLMITVTGKFHVIHAEFLWDEHISDADLADERTFMTEAKQMSLDGDTITWGRNLFMPFYGQKPDPLDVQALKESTIAPVLTTSDVCTIFSGHTPMVGPTRIGPQINLDTMAFGTGRRPWAGLTICEPETGNFWKVTNDDIETQTLEVLL